jgi:hypothetical protein
MISQSNPLRIRSSFSLAFVTHGRDHCITRMHELWCYSRHYIKVEALVHCIFTHSTYSKMDFPHQSTIVYANAHPTGYVYGVLTCLCMLYLWNEYAWTHWCTLSPDHAYSSCNVHTTYVHACMYSRLWYLLCPSWFPKVPFSLQTPTDICALLIVVQFY